jgi:fimbrial chaperone protein
MIALALLLCLPFSASAFQLTPMVHSIPVSGPQASATFSVENNSKGKMAIQFEVLGREIDEEGNETRPKVEGFLVYPEQMALEPGEKRSVRVSWEGAAAPARELPFRFVATQLPVNFQGGEKNGGVKLNFLIEYVASLYLTPASAAPKMKVLSHSVKDGTLEILVANEGSAHFLFDRAQVQVFSGGKELKLGGDALKNLRSENFLPGNRRKLKIPLPAGTKAESLKVNINFHP